MFTTEGLDVVNTKSERTGCYHKTRLWIRGHVKLPEDQGVRYRYISGITGPETEITVEGIAALYTFEVVPAILEANA